MPCCGTALPRRALVLAVPAVREVHQRLGEVADLVLDDRVPSPPGRPQVLVVLITI